MATADILTAIALDDEETIFLFVLNNTALNFRFPFTGYKNVIYGQENYAPIPCKISNLHYASSGAEDQPVITIQDLTGALSNQIRLLGGIEGSELWVRRVKRRNLDDGLTPNFAYTNPPDIFTITQKTSDKAGTISYKMRSRATMSTSQIPGRQIQANCTWKVYRGAQCGYTGTAMFTVYDQPTNDPTQDICGLTKNSCAIRNNLINFSGVPDIDDIASN
jgi:lambda family phage minor tail protein L